MIEKQECPVCHRMYADLKRHIARGITWRHVRLQHAEEAYEMRLRKAGWHKNIKEEAAKLIAERTEEKSPIKSDRVQRKKAWRELVQTIQEVKT